MSEMNSKTLTSNKKMLAIFLGVALCATFGASLAYAQTPTTPSTPKITGSVVLPGIILSEVKTSFVNAANSAASAQGITNGQVLSGGLRVIQGSLVYAFKVTDGTNVYSVIVDAGNGSVLHVSTGHPLTLSALGIGHAGMGHMGKMGQGAWKQKSSTTGSSTGSS